jgi:hypothetical protein
MMEDCAAFDFPHVQATQAVLTSSSAGTWRCLHFVPILISAAGTCQLPVCADQTGPLLSQIQQRFVCAAALAPLQLPAVQFLPVHAILPFPG